MLNLLNVADIIHFVKTGAMKYFGNNRYGQLGLGDIDNRKNQ